MRPVERGPAPLTHSKYEQAASDLEDRLGRYCSYCERMIPTSLAVEHVVAKSEDPGRRDSWDNLLLCCANCNAVKGTTPIDEITTLLPDRDNTVRAFEYVEGGFVRLAPDLDAENQERARGLMNLIGLDRHGAGDWPRPAKRDRRWEDREKIWALACNTRANVCALNTTEARALAGVTAVGMGFFSVWLTVFYDDPDVKSELIRRFPGTSAECFDGMGNPIPRPGGRL